MVFNNICMFVTRLSIMMKSFLCCPSVTWSRSNRTTYWTNRILMPPTEQSSCQCMPSSGQAQNIMAIILVAWFSFLSERVGISSFHFLCFLDTNIVGKPQGDGINTLFRSTILKDMTFHTNCSKGGASILTFPQHTHLTPNRLHRKHPIIELKFLEHNSTIHGLWDGSSWPILSSGSLSLFRIW